MLRPLAHAYESELLPFGSRDIHPTAVVTDLKLQFVGGMTRYDTRR